MKTSAKGYRYLRVDGDNLRHELYLTSIGCLEHRAREPYPSRGHPDGYQFDWQRGRILGDFALIFLSRGGGSLETRAGRSVCRAGDALLIPPGVWHRYRPDEASGWCEHWICANGELLHRLRAKGRLVNEAVVKPGAASPSLRQAHARLWTQVRRPGTANDLALGAAALELFGLALQKEARAVQTKKAPPGADGVAEAARDYIRFNSHRLLTVSLIAQQAGVSRRTLERRYWLQHGVTVANDVTACRVERARQLLTETRMSVKEISYAVGFGDARRLIRSFARAIGSTPAAFRRHGAGL